MLNSAIDGICAATAQFQISVHNCIILGSHCNKNIESVTSCKYDQQSPH